jgi:hypothetical protein
LGVQIVEVGETAPGQEVGFDEQEVSLDAPLQMSSQLHLMQLIGRNCFV